MNNRKKRLSLLNYEGDIFKIVQHRDIFDTYDIVDFTGHSVRQGINAEAVMAIFDGIEFIKTSEGRVYDLSKEHPDAKPSRKDLLRFLGIEAQKVALITGVKNLSISFELSDKQQAKFDEWREAIHKIYGEYGHFKWTISPTGIGNGIEVWSSLSKTSLDLTDMETW